MAALPDPLRARLAAMYGEPHRAYHTLAHIDALLRRLARRRARLRDARAVEAAIWFHDAIYDPRRSDNEARSAQLARTELAAIGWPKRTIERVAHMVLATQHHDAAETDPDTLLFLDLDLSVLGQHTAVYDAYCQGVRAEYAWVDAARYREGRARVLRSFLERAAIYRTPVLRRAWEARARRNLARELQALAGQSG